MPLLISTLVLNKEASNTQTIATGINLILHFSKNTLPVYPIIKYIKPDNIHLMKRIGIKYATINDATAATRPI